MVVTMKLFVRNKSLDQLRGISVLGMILYHAIFIASYTDIIGPQILENVLVRVMADTVRIVFFILVGVSSWLVYSKNDNWRAYVLSQLKRVNRLLYLAISITIVTFVLFRESAVYFGVLHSIGFGIILSMWFVKSYYLSLLAAVVLFVSGFYFGICQDSLYILGYISGSGSMVMNTFDYFPLSPWVGYIFAGQILAKYLIRILDLFFCFNNRFWSALAWIGRNSLVLYMLHIPFLYSFAWLVSFFMLD